MNLDTRKLVNLDPWQLGGVLPPGINFEFPEAGGDGGGGGVATIDAGADGAVPPPAVDGGAVVPPVEGGVPAAEAVPAQPEYLTPDHPAFQTVLSVSQQLGEALEQARVREAEAATAAQQNGDGLPELDFTDPESVIAHAEHRASQKMATMLQEALAPIQAYMPIIESMSRGEGERITGGILEELGIPETIGEGEQIARPREMATKLAAAYMRGGTDPEQAVREAADQVKQLLGIAGSSAVGEHIDRATGLRKVVAAPGAGTSLVEGGGNEGLDPLRPSRYSDAVRNALSAQQPRQPGT